MRRPTIPDILDRLTDLFAECLASGSPPFGDFAERARAIVHRSLVEECCAGAVVGRLPTPSGMSRPQEIRHRWWRELPLVPIAAAPVSLADKVAVEMSQRAGCEDPFPFAAAYTDAGGVRTWVLASVACPMCCCEPNGAEVQGETPTQHCIVCSGIGARTDVSLVAARYGGEGTVRLAKFETKL